MRIAVYHTSEVVVTLPFGFGIEKAGEYVREKRNWILKTLAHFKKYEKLTFIKSSRKDYLNFKPAALALAKTKVAQWNNFFQFSYNRVNIKNQATRWGSCSKRGNLNFNYQIVRLPEKFLDYLIVHELCHLKEFNHSPKFWALVQLAIPDYKLVRREFKKLALFKP